MAKIIGFLGNKGSGKDTAGNYLVQHHNYKRYAFADPIKEISRHLFSLDDTQLYGGKKNIIDERWNLTPRTIFQRLGTEFGHYTIYNLFPELKKTVNTKQLWVTLFELWLEKNKNEKIVITDVRFGHEIYIIKKYGGEIIKIINPKVKNNDKHSSETELNTLNYDEKIINNKDLTHLFTQINLFVNVPF